MGGGNKSRTKRGGKNNTHKRSVWAEAERKSKEDLKREAAKQEAEVTGDGREKETLVVTDTRPLQ